MTRKIKISIWFCLFVLSLFFWRVDASKAFLGSAECASKGGSCDFTCFSSDYESLGMCDYGMAICCRKKLADTSGADPDPMGVGNSQAGGTVATGTSGVTDSNAGLGGAQGGTVTPGTSGISATSSTAANTATTTSSGNENTGGLVPCKNNCTLCHLVIGIKNIFEYLVYTVLFPLFTLGIVISGVLYMVSSGNKGLTEKAKTALTYSLMGAVVALTSWLLVNATLYAIGYKSVGSWSNFTCDTTQSAPQISTPGGGTLPSGSGLVSSGNATLDQVAQNLKEHTVYVNYSRPENANAPRGWVGDTFYGDCSSWVQEFEKQAFGWNPGGTTAEQLQNAERDASGNLATNASTLRPGDVVVSTGSGDTGRHSSVYMGNNMVISNYGTGYDVRVTPLKEEKILGIVRAPV